MNICITKPESSRAAVTYADGHGRMQAVRDAVVE